MTIEISQVAQPYQLHTKKGRFYLFWGEEEPEVEEPGLMLTEKAALALETLMKQEQITDVTEALNLILESMVEEE